MSSPRRCSMNNSNSKSSPRLAVRCPPLCLLCPEVPLQLPQARPVASVDRVFDQAPTSRFYYTAERCFGLCAISITTGVYWTWTNPYLQMYDARPSDTKPMSRQVMFLPLPRGTAAVPATCEKRSSVIICVLYSVCKASFFFFFAFFSYMFLLGAGEVWRFCSQSLCVLQLLSPKPSGARSPIKSLYY